MALQRRVDTADEVSGADRAGRMIRRDFGRTFTAATVASLACGSLATACAERNASSDSNATLRVWATSDAHVGTDRRHGRESLGAAIRQSEGGEESPPFGWDVALHLGDFSGNQGSPKDDEGAEVVRQFRALRRHDREQFYCLAGNHDATLKGEPTQWWFRKWIDPTGEHPKHSGVDAQNRPYPVEGTWERYSFRIGNIVFAMMSDRNDVGPPVGRARRGGYPAGAVTSQTFDWWKRLVEANDDDIIISAHHHMLKETTVASGEWEGFRKTAEGKWASDYHGYFSRGAPKGASYLYWLDKRPDAQAFERYLAAHPGAIDMWLGGHTHTHPDDRKGGRSHIEQKWGVHFANISALTRWHGKKHSTPMSRLLTFVDGSDEVRIQCYLHSSNYRRQGWYGSAERTIRLQRPFRMS